MTLFKLGLPLLTGTLLIASSGSALYNKECKACHGTKAEKKAMGKSKAIKGMSVASIEKSMQEYASGKKKTIPAIKKVKKTFIKKHTEEELHQVAQYIHQL